MAYVVWRVLLKKYVQIRQGIHQQSIPNHPVNGDQGDENSEGNREVNPSKSEKKKDDGQNSIKSGAWSNNEDEDEATSQVQFRRSKSLSRTKKVKKYLTKKIKDPIVAAVEDKVNRSSWYVSQDKANEQIDPVVVCDQVSSQNDIVSLRESAGNNFSSRSRSSWYVHQEKSPDEQCDSVVTAETNASKADDAEIDSKTPSQHVSRCSLVESHSHESFSDAQKIQNIIPNINVPRKIKQSKSIDGSCQTFLRQGTQYKSLDSRSREKRLSNPFDIFNCHNPLSAQNKKHRKSKENFVIDRNKLETSIEQLTALKTELNSGCRGERNVPSSKCDTKVQRVPPNSPSKSNRVHKSNMKQVSQSSESLPKINPVLQEESDLLDEKLERSKENIPRVRPSYSDILKTKIPTTAETFADVSENLASNAGKDTPCEILDDHHIPTSEDSGIADPLSFSEDCSDRISLSEDFSLSAEDLVSCIDFLDLNTESIVPPSSALSSSASFNSSLETVISANHNNLEEEEEYVTKVPSSMKGQSELCSLVDRFIGPHYLNYEYTRNILTRQGRDIFLCSYLGDVDKFRTGFCVPACALMDEIFSRAKVKVGNLVSPRGWPFCLNQNAVVINLLEIESTLLRNRDFYLFLKINERTKSCLLHLSYKLHDRIVTRQISKYDSIMSVLDLASSPAQLMEERPDYAVEDLCNVDLVNDLCSLITSVDHAIERVALDDLAFPCPSCQQCILQSADEDYAKCECGASRSDKSNPIAQSHESIPHIDSDEESIPDTDKSIMGARKLDDFKFSTSIAEIPENLLMSGIHFPGIHDTSGRSVIVYDAAAVAKSCLDPSDIGKVILYFVSLPVRPERTKHGVTLLVLSGLPGDSTYDLLDKALTFLESKLHIACLLVWRKSASGPRVTEAHRQRLQRSNSNVLPNSKIEYQVLDDIDRLRHYLEEEQTPAECGGPTSHDQLEWVEFYKEYEPFLSQCHTCGRSLVTTLADIRDVTESSESDRRSLMTSHRAIVRVLSDPALCKLRRDGHRTLTQLEERAHWLPYSEDVKICVERADRLFAEVERGSKRLEQLCQKRKEKIREQQRMKALHSETTEVLSWLKSKGATTLKRHASLASTLPALKAQEQDFEKFYFISMRNLDKAGDLLEECGGTSPSLAVAGGGLKDLARHLKQHLRGFSERLEDTRERLEDTSRCYYLLDRAYEWALEAMKYISRVKPEDQTSSEPTVKQLRQYLMAHPPLTSEHFSEMIQLARKLNNDKLIEQCKVAQCRCEETLDQIRSYLGAETPPTWTSSTPLPSRRKSLPAPHPPALAPSHACPCWDPGDPAPSPSPSPSSIPEECYCQTGNHTSHPLQRSCTWQYPTENYDEEEDKASSVDNTTEGSDTGKSGEECEESSENSLSKAMPPVSVNSHLHYSQLSLDLDSANCGAQTLKTQKNLLFIMREMIQTERDYVKSLEYVILNYIPELSREDIPQALRGQRNVIFGNIEKIYEFHSQHFLTELEQCASVPLSVGRCFLNHENKFYLYALYNKNKPKSDALMTEYGVSFFKAKQVELADRMDLASYLLKPVQRMGKYALLLQQLMKASRQDGKDIKDIQEAESMVRFQLRHGNDLLAMDSLRECDVNLKEQGRLLRQNEFIVSQGKGKKCLRHVFLFEELILFSKARRFPDRKNLDLYIYKHSMKMSDIGITAQIGDSSTKFEIWFRKRKPNETFALQSVSEDIKQAWTDELSNLLWKQALRNRAMRLQEMSSMGIGNKPCLDIRPSADQISDRSISITQLNKTTPKFRNSVILSGSGGLASSESGGGARTRPHSIISLSSSSSGGSSSGSVGGGCVRQTSQCSSAESGIVTDWHTTRSNSSVTSDSTSPGHQVSVKL